MHSCKLFVFFLGPEWKKKCTSRSSTVQTASPNLPFSLREKCSPSPLIPVLLRCSNYDPCPNCVLTRLLQLHIYFTMSLKSLERIQSSAAFPFFFFFFFKITVTVPLCNTGPRMLQTHLFKTDTQCLLLYTAPCNYCTLLMD